MVVPFLDLGGSRVVNLMIFVTHCVTGIVRYPEHFAEPKYLQ